MKKPKLSKAYIARKHLPAIRVAGGFYITDCYPWTIKAGCESRLCPMRELALPPEAKETDYLLECQPVGILETLLRMLRGSPQATRSKAGKGQIDTTSQSG